MLHARLLGVAVKPPACSRFVPSSVIAPPAATFQKLLSISTTTRFCYGDEVETGECVTLEALVVNGTSLAAPNMAAAYAAYYGTRLGLAQTCLYNGFVKKTYPLSPTKKCTAWHEIMSGSNSIYAAHASFNAVTGVGSLDMDCYMLQLPHSGSTAL
jgi:hypothetical protein